MSKTDTFYPPVHRFKQHFIHANLSSSFVVRAKCKYCLGGPKHYWSSRNKSYCSSPDAMQTRFLAVKKSSKRFCQDYYLDSNPREFTGLSAFVFTVSFKSYPARLHKNKGVSSFERTEIVECECGKTQWAFNEKSSRNRPEITQRKARYKYPQGFEY